MTPSIGALTIRGSFATIFAGASVDMGTGMASAPSVAAASIHVVVRLSPHRHRRLFDGPTACQA